MGDRRTAISLLVVAAVMPPFGTATATESRWPQTWASPGRTWYAQDDGSLTPEWVVGAGPRSVGFAFPLRWVGTPVVADDGDLIVTNWDRYDASGFLYRITPRGERRWRVPIPCPIGSLMVAGRVIVYEPRANVCAGMRTTAYRSDGKQLWHRNIQAIVAADGLIVGFGPSDDAGPYTLHAVEAPSGTDAWCIAVEGTPSGPVIADDSVIVGDGATLRSYSLSTGAPGWSEPFDGMYGVTPMAYAEGVLVALDYRLSDSSLRIDGVDASTGQPLWSHEADGAFFAGMIAIGDGAVFATLYDRFIALDLATGDDLWSRAGGPAYRVQPSGADGVVYEYVTIHGRPGILAFDAADGSRLRRIPGYLGAIATEDRLYLGGSDHRLLVLR